MQAANTAAWRCLRPSVCQMRWSWWNLPCTAAWGPAGAQWGSLGQSAAAPTSWQSSTGDVRDVAVAGSNFRIPTCTPSVAARPRRWHTLKQPTRAYLVSVRVWILGKLLRGSGGSGSQSWGQGVARGFCRGRDLRSGVQRQIPGLGSGKTKQPQHFV